MDLDVAIMLMLAGSTLLLIFLGFITLMFWPAVILKVYNWFLRWRLGLKVDYAYCGKYRFCYSHRGKPGGTTPSLLLLHGFSLNKDMWVHIVKCLPRSQHVVCVDMPGHEGTSRTNAEDYCIEGQVKRIHQFVQSVHLNRRPFHLVGTSMGGNVAGVYAARFSAHLSGVTLICPAGLVLPTESVFVKRLRELEQSQNVEDIPLIPSTPQGMEDMLKLCFCFKIPRQIIQTQSDVWIPNNAFYRKILQGLIDERIPNNDFYREAFLEIVGEKSRHSLQDNLHLITAPLQVIWGKHDQVVDVSGASVLQEVHPECQVTLLDNCGHSVVLERPRKAAQLIMDFLSAREVNGNAMKLVEERIFNFKNNKILNREIG